MNIKIKILTDKNEIAGVITECAEAFHDQTCNDPARIHDFAEKFASKACFLAAFSGGEVIGFAAFYCNDETTSTAFISMIVVKNIYHYNGGGGGLLSKIKEICRNKGMKRIRLEVANDNQKALLFYQHRGFIFEAPSGEKSSFYSLSL